MEAARPYTAQDVGIRMHSARRRRVPSYVTAFGTGGSTGD